MVTVSNLKTYCIYCLHPCLLLWGRYSSWTEPIEHILPLQTKENQQEYSRRSNWLSLWCLGPWVNHLTPVLWSILGLSFFELQLTCQLGKAKRNFLLIPCPYSRFYIILNFCQLLTILNNFFILSTLRFHTFNLNSFFITSEYEWHKSHKSIQDDERKAKM